MHIQLQGMRGWPDDVTELPGVGPYTAAAIANFALGRPELPVDTNVRRIQERTAHQFTAAAAQALDWHQGEKWGPHCRGVGRPGADRPGARMA